MKVWCLFLLNLVSLGVIHSQSFSAHVPGLKWTRLQSKEVNILFPQGLKLQAENVYHRIKGFYDTDSSLGNNRFKLNLVLQNQTVRANGYVGIGPFMSEFFLTPSWDSYALGSVDWTELLTIHEYRHVLQAMNSRKGIARWLYILMGEEAWGASYGLAIPDWFLEGDAVAAETRLTTGGRGRMPAFAAEYRALLQSNIQWPYIKARNGSLKSIVPNEYITGYTMVNHINQQFGTETWGRIFADAVRYKGLITPFAKALSRHTRLTPSTLYQQAIAQYNPGPFAVITPQVKDAGHTKNQKIKNYLSPNRLQDGSVLCLETSFDQLPRFIQIKDEKITDAYTNMGISTIEDFGFNEPLITWTEINLDPRWEQRNYSDVYTYNIYTRERKKISQHQKYLFTAPSNDGTKIACAEYLPVGQCNLVILDHQGKKLNTITIPEGQLATFPSFENGDSTLLVVLRGSGLSSIVRYSLSSGSFSEITPPVFSIVSNPTMNNNDTIFFSSDISGRDNIYAIDPVNKQIYQLTDDPVGIQQFNIYGNEIIYQVQTAFGIKIRSLYTDAIPFKPVGYFKKGTLGVHLNDTTTGSTGKFKFEPSGLWSNPFRVYSWALRPDEGGNVFRILGRNILNTVQSTVAYHFLQDDGSQSVTGNLAFGFTYPVFTAALGHTWNRSISKQNNPLQDSISWNETNYRIGTYIPLKWFIRNQIIQIQPTFQFGRYEPDYRTGDRSNYQSTSFLRTGITFLSFQRRALQHASSRYQQGFTLNWNRALNHRANSLEVNSEWHFPGLRKNHVFEIQADYHRQLRTDPYRFPTGNDFISGYSSFTSDHASRWRIAYHFPWSYPDKGINGLIYIKRIRSRFFHEQMRSTLKRQRDKFEVNYASSGTELLLDGNGLNVLPISFGVRFSYLWDRDLIRNSQKPRLEFIIEQLF